MKRDLPDFFIVAPEHQAIHQRLENWARYVAVKRPQWMHPMWAQSRSNSRQWHQPEPKQLVDTLDGSEMEKAVRNLPDKHRDAVRWSYVFKTNPSKARQYLGVTDGGLWELVRLGRQMLVNRNV